MSSDAGGLFPGTAAVVDQNIDQIVDAKWITPLCQANGLIIITSLFPHDLDPTKPISKTYCEFDENFSLSFKIFALHILLYKNLGQFVKS